MDGITDSMDMNLGKLQEMVRGQRGLGVGHVLATEPQEQRSLPTECQWHLSPTSYINQKDSGFCQMNSVRPKLPPTENY